MPSPEHTVRDLHDNHAGLLHRATAIDRAAKQLTSDVASERPGRLGSPDEAVLDRSADTAALVNHALAAGHYPTATVLPPAARPASNLTGMLAIVAIIVLLVCTGSFAIGLGPAFGCWCISRGAYRKPRTAAFRRSSET